MSDIEALDPEAQHALLTLARRAITEHLTRGRVPDEEPEHEALHAELAAFVTLEQDGKLRGCVGQPDASGPLHEAVARTAVAAAIEDPHFSALELSDIRYTEIEISVLSPMTPITPEEIEIGLHGLYVAQGRKRGVFLPQVPVQYGWDVSQYLKELLSKGGLDPGAYDDPQTRLFGFTAEVFSEGDLQREEPEGPY